MIFAYEKLAVCRTFVGLFSFAIIATAQAITDIPELHDRLIAATAVHLRLPLITNDTKISNSAHVQTIW
jgi:predicted nucleic acid-binding protein